MVTTIVWMRVMKVHRVQHLKIIMLAQHRILVQRIQIVTFSQRDQLVFVHLVIDSMRKLENARFLLLFFHSSLVKINIKRKIYIFVGYKRMSHVWYLFTRLFQYRRLVSLCLCTQIQIKRG